jgi:hypothetical protein
MTAFRTLLLNRTYGLTATYVDELMHYPYVGHSRKVANVVMFKA